MAGDLLPHRCCPGLARLKGKKPAGTGAMGAATCMRAFGVEAVRPPHQRLTGQVKNSGETAGTLAERGSPTWARTRDLRINSPSLYRLSYRGNEALHYSVAS
jgi:hypothetical protein